MPLADLAKGPLIGPVVGPVAGGFLAHAEGWRWVFWLLAILSGTMSLIALPILRETYAPVLLACRAEPADGAASSPTMHLSPLQLGALLLGLY